MGGKLTTALLVGLGIATLTSCMPRPTQYATRDYASYPGKQDAVALRNIERIFSSACSTLEIGGYKYKFKVSEQGLKCSQTYCAEYKGQTGKNVFGQHTYDLVCGGSKTYELDVSWDEVLYPRIIPFQYPKTGLCVMFTNNKEKCDFRATDMRQAEGFAEAIRIYLTQRNKTYTPSTNPPAATVPSTTKTPTTTPGCEHDLQCKGERVCVQGDCVNP